MQNLVIVESPTKARTLSKFLGKDYQVEASMGHIRDLPKGNFGVDIENNFEPQYVIPRDKRKKVNELKKLAQNAKFLWLATDPDREGEAIAWHLAYILASKDHQGVKRVEFHEITQDAIKDAFKHPRDIDLKLVDAQQARRILDRLVGYKLSPVLWEKVKRGLSAGRVQSVALRLIVEREREIQIFVPVEYWSIEVQLQTAKKSKFVASVIELNGRKLEVHDQEQADFHVKNLEDSTYTIYKVKQIDVNRTPAPPFTTSTLQQSAGNKIGYSSKKTMMLAQNLYEQGFITYMRTDSVNISIQAKSQTKDYINKNYGQNYLPKYNRVFKSRSKNAQEAHEAIRPTNMNLTSAELQGQLITRDHIKLYDLIWKRMLASQMADAVLKQTTIDVIAKSKAFSHQLSDNTKKESDDGRLTTDDYLLRATGSVIQFDGWMKLYQRAVSGADQESPKSAEEQSEEKEDDEKILPQVLVGEALNLLQLLPDQHFTEAPPRYTEPSLVKKLEELGIGRPSTYAPILSTIQERYYVEKQERKFIPTALGITVADFLIANFPDVFDYQFTAEMEDKLDDISRGERQWRQTLSEFYKPLETKIEITSQNTQKVVLEVQQSDKLCPNCGKNLIVRTGKFGKFLACSGFPDCKHTEGFETKIDAKCPQDGGDIVARRTKKGKSFYGCKNYPNCKYATWQKPKESKSEEATVSPKTST